MDKKKLGIIAAIVVVILVVVGALTNWFGLAKKAEEVVESLQGSVAEVVNDVTTAVEEAVETVESATGLDLNGDGTTAPAAE